MTTLIRYFDFPKFGDLSDTIQTIIHILVDIDVRTHNIKSIRAWKDFMDLSSTKGRGMFFHVMKRDHVALLVIDLYMLLSPNKRMERQSFHVLIDQLKADPEKKCDMADLDLLQTELHAFRKAEAPMMKALETYRKKRFAHRDPDGPDDGMHLIPDIERIAEHCNGFLNRILTVAYKPTQPLEIVNGHPTMFIDGLIADYREHARLLDAEAGRATGPLVHGC